MCNLRFDDTNATTEDIRERLYEIAEALVQAGRAYVEMLIGEEK